MNVQLLDEAEQDLIDGYRFYETQDQGLGDYFLNSLFSEIDSLRLYAGIHSVHFGYHRLIIQGDGKKQDQSSLRLGLEALLVGSEKNLVNVNRFIGMVANDYAAASAINEAFSLVLERVGIPPMQVDERG